MPTIKPELIACSFDLAGPTFRRDLAADYKATRSPMPPDLVEQVPHVHDVCAALGVPVLTYERYEADDVLATLAMQAAEAGYEVALVTGDKDFFQLVGCVEGRIKVYNPRDEGTWFDPDGVVTKFGVRPDQVVDVLALMGDTIDNVKGVPGIGEKGARDLIATHGTLDALLENAATITQKRYREALLANADQARQSRELVRLHTDVPVEFNPDDCKYAGANAARCFELFSKFGFRSLVMEYAPTAQTVTKDYAAIDSLDALEALVKDAREAGAVAMHLVTDTPTAMRAEIVGVTLSFADRQARYVPLARDRRRGVGLGASRVAAARACAGSVWRPRGPPAAPAKKRGSAKAELPPDVGGLDRTRALEILKPLFEDAEVAKTGHDLKNMAIVLARQGIKLRGLETDTILVSYVLDATRSDHRLEDLALEELTYRMTDEEELRGKGVKALPNERVPLDAMLTYAGERADLTWQLGPTPVREDERGGPRFGLSRAGTAARARADRHRDGRRARRRLGARAAGHAARSRSHRARRAHLRHRGRDVQHQLAETAGRCAVRQVEHAGAEAHGRGAHGVDRAGSARRARTFARSPARSSRMARAAEAERHLHRRAAAARASADGPRAHVVQPGDRGHRTPEQQRSESAERADPHRSRPRNPPRVHRGARPPADLRRLLTD